MELKTSRNLWFPQYGVKRTLEVGKHSCYLVRRPWVVVYGGKGPSRTGERTSGCHCLTRDPLSPYYTMRFPCVALAIKPEANEISMQR